MTAAEPVERECHACGRPCEPDPYNPPWCGRCSGLAQEEAAEDRDELNEDRVATHTARVQRLRRAGRVPAA